MSESKFIKSKESQSLIKDKQRDKFQYLKHWGAKYDQGILKEKTNSSCKPITHANT